VWVSFVCISSFPCLYLSLVCVCTDFSCVYICLFVCLQAHVSSMCVKIYNCQILTFHVPLRCLPFPLRLHVFVCVSLCLSVWLRVCLSAPVARLCFPSSARALCLSLAVSLLFAIPVSVPIPLLLYVHVKVCLCLCLCQCLSVPCMSLALPIARLCFHSSARALYLTRFIYISPHSSLSLCTYIHIFIYMCTYIYTYIYTYTHIHIHTYTHTYVHQDCVNSSYLALAM